MTEDWLLVTYAIALWWGIPIIGAVALYFYCTREGER